VTPGGVYQSIVSDAGVPGPWNKIDADVIVSGFGNIPDTPNPPIPVPPVDDPIVNQISEISKSVLKNKDEATAVAAIVNSVGKLNLSPSDFKEALELAAPIADVSLDTKGRIGEWVKQATSVTIDPKKLVAGVSSAFDVSASTLSSIHAAAIDPEVNPAVDPKSVPEGEAVNWALLIAIIQTILELLKNLGIGG